jgi:hypothetical protein
MNESAFLRCRAAIAVSAIAALAVLATACGGGRPAGGAANAGRSAVAYSRCVRSHGLPNFPDPGNGGQIPKADPQQLGVSRSQLESAQHACQRLIPDTGETREQQQELQCALAGDCSQAVVQRWMSGLRQLAGCLRSHGMPNWPDPIIDTQGLPHYPYEQAGIDHHSPPVLAKVDTCARLTGFQGLPLP